MTRLNFRLPDWTRVNWASPLAREVWAPRVQRISQAWERVERAAVVEGVKPSCLQNVAPDRLPALTVELARDGLLVLPLGRAGASGSYASDTRPVIDGQPWVYRVVITRPSLAAEWGEAWARQDDERIGQLLGFPPCCRAFFQKYWKGERWIDTTWPMTDAGEVAGLPPPTLPMQLMRQVTGPVEANILGRWLGVRLVPHLPCSFGCEATAALGRALVPAWERAGAREELAWAREVLSWPTEWSALHGIAEIKTPVYRISTRTDATAGKLIVRREGSAYPAEAPRGLTFPFRPDQPPAAPVRLVRPTDWTDNGFASAAAQERAHSLLERALGGFRPARVLDLGCGNGRLARRLAGPEGHAAGIERDPARAERAGRILNRVTVGDLRRDWYEDGWDLVVLAAARLQEGPVPPAFREWLRGRFVLVYAYRDASGAAPLEERLAASGVIYSVKNFVRDESGEAALVVVK